MSINMEDKPTFSILNDEKANDVSLKSTNTETGIIDYTTLDTKEIILGDYEQAPEYLKDNEFIIKGYRLNCTTISKILRSLFICHNESINIWSHLLGTLSVIFLIFYTAIFVTAYKDSLKSYIDYNALLNEIKDITNPLINSFDEKGLSIEEDNEVYNAIISIKNSTSQFFQEINEKYELTNKIQKYVETVKNILGNIKDKLTIGETSKKLLNNLSSKWGEVQQKLLDLIKGDLVQFDNGKQVSSDATETDSLRRWPLFIMLSSAIVCLSFSTIFHLFGALSPSSSSVLSRLDYAGISILIAGSCYPPYFYFFYCEVYLCTVYLSFISIFAISVFAFALTPDFHVPRRRRLRGTLFLTLGLSAGIPVVHLILFGSHVSGFSGYDTSPNYYYWVFGGVSYVVGALMYIMRIPEKYRPGKHDYFGASHQIFHVLVVVGVVLHYLGSLNSYYYRCSNSCPSNI